MDHRTARLWLRLYRADDVPDLLRYYADPHVCRYLCHDPWTHAEATEAVERRMTRTQLTDGGLNLVAELDGRVIGNVAAWLVDGHDDTVELAWVFAGDVHGRGYATEAVAALLDTVFSVQSIRRVTASMDARNLASARLAERVGMRHEAQFVEDHLCNGEWTDTAAYALLRRERN